MSYNNDNNDTNDIDSNIDDIDIDSYEQQESLEEMGTVDKHSYRVLMYSKLEVDRIEKQAIRTMIKERALGIYADNFVSKAILLYPDFYKDLELKKKRGKKSNNYFTEEIGKWLWVRWFNSRDTDDRNNFITYCYTLIDGVIFKYGRHKHGLSYEEIFQSAVVKIIQAMDKFDPMRQVATDDKGNPIYARVYTYFTMVLNYGITTITMAHGADKISNVSYEQLARMLGDEPDHISDAQTVYQDFLIFLDSVIFSEDCQADIHLEIYKELQKMLATQKDLMFVANNFFPTIKERLGCKQSDITAAMQYLKLQFGPLVILTQQEHFRDFESTD